MTILMVFNLKLLFILFSSLSVFALNKVHAQTILLEIRPRMGDTLKMRMDQKVEMVGMVNGDTTMAKTSCMQLFTRSVPMSFSGNGTVLVTLADSVAVSPKNNPQSLKPQAMQGQIIQLRISTDGAVRVIDTKPAKKPSTFFSNMPATLPNKPITVGETWVRDIMVPAPPQPPSTSAAPASPSEPRNIKATFRLDSLTANGDIAYISMDGVIAPAAGGVKDDISGAINGKMQVDRRMAWMTDSRATINLKTIIDSMEVQVKITQWLRAQ